ncbi:hypothetical protein GCM10009865_54330 [Aeromicrobium ponti]|uniref:Lipoprotein n=1 Tax=Cytobacillus oceanisediminis TaxID=665099 RepID=A0A562J3W1_9BACI|nr:hypothetical protein [Cytobacillus oceanisediminis]TWH77850.1 hypothetical protein IQ19_05555 [Cytobacillus oceanisediminis]
MKQIITVSALILFFLVGCQNNDNGTLDTSKLTEIQMNDVSDAQKEKMPITYEATSVKEGLSALPFEIKLPEKLPFDAKPFQPPTINDMSRDGKKLMVEFKTTSKGNAEQPIILMITALNSEEDLESSNSEEVKLNNEETAYYTNKSLSFNRDGVSYTIT